MMMLMTQGGWGVQNRPKVDGVICARSLKPLAQVLKSFLEINSLGQKRGNSMPSVSKESNS